MLRRAGMVWSGNVQPNPGLRRGRRGDAHAIATLARTAILDQQRALLEFREWNYVLGWERALDSLLERRRETWWVVESDRVIQGALWVVHELRQRPDRMEIFVHPAHHGETEAQLVLQGLDTLHGAPKNPIETSIVAPADSTIAAFEQAGFRKFQALTQMRLNLGHQVPVRHF